MSIASSALIHSTSRKTRYQLLVAAVRDRFTLAERTKQRDRIGTLQVQVMEHLAFSPLVSAREIAEALDRRDDSPIYGALRALEADGRVSPFIDPSGDGKYTAAVTYALTPAGWFDVVRLAIDRGDQRANELLALLFLALPDKWTGVTN
jgi:hypothetical protein